MFAMARTSGHKLFLTSFLNVNSRCLKFLALLTRHDHSLPYQTNSKPTSTGSTGGTINKDSGYPSQFTLTLSCYLCFLLHLKVENRALNKFVGIGISLPSLASNGSPYQWLNDLCLPLNWCIGERLFLFVQSMADPSQNLYLLWTNFNQLQHMNFVNVLFTFVVNCDWWFFLGRKSVEGDAGFEPGTASLGNRDKMWVGSPNLLETK